MFPQLERLGLMNAIVNCWFYRERRKSARIWYNSRARILAFLFILMACSSDMSPTPTHKKDMSIIERKSNFVMLDSTRLSPIVLFLFQLENNCIYEACWVDAQGDTIPWAWAETVGVQPRTHFPRTVGEFHPYTNAVPPPNGAYIVIRQTWPSRRWVVR